MAGGSAEAELTARIKADPADALAHRALALLLGEQGLFVDAERRAQQYRRLCPHAPDPYDILGSLLTDAGRPAVAETYYRSAIQLSGAKVDPYTRLRLAKCLRNQGKTALARGQYQIVGMDFMPAWGLTEWAELEADDRKLAFAVTLLARVDRAQPENQNHRVSLARLFLRLGRRQKAMAKLKTIEDAYLDETGLAEKGLLLDAMGRYQAAWYCWSQAKARTQAHYQRNAAEDMLDRLRAFWVPHNELMLSPATLREGVPQPIFLMGFPRSGTSLVEQMLSNHPQIVGGGELHAIQEVISAIPNFLNSAMSYPEALGELIYPDQLGSVDRLRDLYLSHAEQSCPMQPGTRWFVDKMPLNETHLGLIRLLFPDAPMIHVVRHPMDVMLSAYGNPINHGWLCASGLQSAADHYANVMALVDDTYLAEGEAAEPTYYRLSYEALVRRPEWEMAMLLEHIGAPYHKACVHPESNLRYVATPSRTQVTQPINTDSIGRWRHYQTFLEPIAATLAPWMPLQ